LKGPIRSLEVTYLLHATEDPVKVAKAVAKMLSAGAPAEVEGLEGHYGNRIERIRVHLTGDDAQRAFDRIVSGLSDEQRSRLVGSLGSFLDEHSALFLRFDKQRLVLGSLSLESADPVRVKVKPRPFLMSGDARKFYSGLFER
jgi:RNA binding exosome subunit